MHSFTHLFKSCKSPVTGPVMDVKDTKNPVLKFISWQKQLQGNDEKARLNRPVVAEGVSCRTVKEEVNRHKGK